MGRRSTPSQKDLITQHREVLRECQKKAANYFSTSINRLLEDSETALLDFADEAESNQFYTYFLDAINLIKGNHEKVEEIFSELINNGFDQFIDGENLFDTTIINTDKSDQLELIDPKEMDENVAVEKIISRIRNNSFQELYAMGQRLSLLHEGEQLKEHNIPSGPHHVVKSFHHAIKQIPIESDIRIVLLALLDNHVTRNAETIYHEINDLLAAAGLFPNLKPIAKKNPSNTTKQKDTQQSGDYTDNDSSLDSEPEQSVEIGREVFNSICKLLGTRRSMDPEYHPHPGMSRENIETTMALVDNIGNIQQQGYTNFANMTTGANQQLPDIKFDEALLKQRGAALTEEREQLLSVMDKNKIPAADMNIIDVVGMMFQYALSDDELPNIVKVLLSHLHTPYLKVALLDRNFLIDSKHVARRLLNSMAKSGRKWVDEKRLDAGIYFSLERYIERILHEFQDDINLFDEIFAELQQEIKQFEKKVKVIETRAKEAEKGRERLTYARTRAAEAMDEQIGQRHLPDEIEQFLHHPWLDRMTLILLRDHEAEQRSTWQESLEIADTLAWAAEANRDIAVKEELRVKLPGLKRQIVKSLTPFGEPFFAYNDAMFDLLSDYLATGIIDSPVDGEQPEKAPPKPARKKITIPTLSKQEEKIVAQLKNTSFDTWFLFQDTGMGARELKLSWFSRLTGKFMFVDHYGAKAIIIHIDELANLMYNNKVKIITRSVAPFVDRALKAIRNTLTKTFGKKAKPT
jgi:hypothetical protein